MRVELLARCLFGNAAHVVLTRVSRCILPVRLTTVQKELRTPTQVTTTEVVVLASPSAGCFLKHRGCCAFKLIAADMALAYDIVCRPPGHD